MELGTRSEVKQQICSLLASDTHSLYLSLGFIICEMGTIMLFVRIK